MSIDKVHIIELKTIRDRRGNLSIIESGESIPFEVPQRFNMEAKLKPL